MTEHPIKWGDAQQYHAEAQPSYQGEEKGVWPSVHLLWMTPDPLGAVAAMAEMYRGNVIRDLAEVTDDMRRRAFEDVQQTHLKAPLEAVKLHFMIEGVDRAFTHQLVRQRTAVYAQESMRFSVLGKLHEATTLPPSLQGTRREVDMSGPITREQSWRYDWDIAIDELDRVYHKLVESGMPAEEARGLLPHCTATRLNYVTDLRNLSDHAGNRLCTQAQFHWRAVFAQIMLAIREHPDPDWQDEWQYRALAESALFRPVCYQLGHCPFQASFDRACTIRNRVEMFSEHGIPPAQWGDKDKVVNGIPIQIEEWLLNPAAARKVR